MKKRKKILAVALTTTMVALLAVLCLVLFSDNIFHATETATKALGITTSADDTSETEGTESSGDSATPETDTTKDSENQDEETVETLTATYTGGTLYATGHALASDFTVEVVYGDGTEREVVDYTSEELSNNRTLQVGENTFTFAYDGLQTQVTVTAIDYHTLAYPPSYSTVAVNAAQAEDTILQIQNGQLTYQDVFSEVAFSGDSQIKALATNDIISMEQIVAEIGMSFEYLDAHFADVVAIAQNKKVLLLHYGINTLNLSEQTRIDNVSYYKDIITRLQAALPNVRIIVSGVFPVADTIVNSQERFQYITSYDFLILDMCMSLGIDYLSNNEYMVSHQEVFGSDGLHLTPEFYTEYWLKSLIRTMGI